MFRQKSLVFNITIWQNFMLLFEIVIAQKINEKSAYEIYEWPQDKLFLWCGHSAAMELWR